MWDSKLDTGKKIPFTFSFFDANANPAKDVLFAYSILDSSGKEIWSNAGTTETHIGILAPNGIMQENILIPTDGKFQLKLILTGQNSKYLTLVWPHNPPHRKKSLPLFQHG